MATSALDRLRAANEKKNESEAFRADYAAYRETLSPEDAEELAEILRVDLAEGPGVERPFPMTLEERRACWRDWFKGKLTKNTAAGINGRIRSAIATKDAASQAGV